MEPARIAELLAPFTAPTDLSPGMLAQLQSYLDLLLRWNARMNLTAVRHPEQVITRHFGESLFAAQVLLGGADGSNKAFPQGLKPALETDRNGTAETVPLQGHVGHLTLADIGSGAGFPGIPMKLFAPEIELTLIESQSKKATFLREVIRTLGLEGVSVFCGRAEQWSKTADLVTLRAVEQFERALPVAAELVAGQGKLCLLIGAGQVPSARQILGATWEWQAPEAVPRTNGRVILVGRRPESAILLPFREDE
jgi:16S rRNA (guanine527-N7)-methyltransferase